MSGGPDNRPFQVGDTVQIRQFERVLGSLEDGPETNCIYPHQRGDVGIITTIAQRPHTVIGVLVPYRAPCAPYRSDLRDLIPEGSGIYYPRELDLLKPQHPE